MKKNTNTEIMKETNYIWFESMFFECLKISKEINYIKKHEGYFKEVDYVLSNIKENLIWKFGIFLRTLVEYIIKNEYDLIEIRRIRDIIAKLINTKVINEENNSLFFYLKYLKQNLDYYFAHLRHPNYNKTDYNYSNDTINKNIKIWIEYIFNSETYLYIFKNKEKNYYNEINIMWLEIIISSFKRNQKYFNKIK